MVHFHIFKSDDEDSEWKMYISECRDIFEDPESGTDASDEPIVSTMISN